MERGTDRERERVAEEWASLARRNHLARRFSSGLVLVFVGVLALSGSLVSQVCLSNYRLNAAECTAVTLAPGHQWGLVALGTGGVLVGGWFLWTALGHDSG